MSTQLDPVAQPPIEHNILPSIDETCCGKCPGATCYVDYITGERS